MRNQWILVQQVGAPPDTSKYTTAYFGTSLAFDAAGETLIVGAPGSLLLTPPTGIKPGTVWLLFRDREKCCFCLNSDPLTSGKTTVDQFGYSIGLSANGKTVLVAVTHISACFIFAIFPNKRECTYYASAPIGNGVSGTHVSISTISSDGNSIAYSGPNVDLINIVLPYLYSTGTGTGNNMLISAAGGSIADISATGLSLSGDGKTLLVVSNNDGKTVIQSYTQGYVGPGVTSSITYSPHHPITLNCKTASSSVSMTPSGNRAVVGLTLTDGRTQSIIIG